MPRYEKTCCSVSERESSSVQRFEEALHGLVVVVGTREMDESDLLKRARGSHGVVCLARFEKLILGVFQFFLYRRTLLFLEEALVPLDHRVGGGLCMERATEKYQREQCEWLQ